MHTYLRAIGFSNIKNRADLDQLIGMVMTAPTEKYTHIANEREDFVEISKDFSDKVGITVRGVYDEKGFFHLDHYFPYLRAQNISVREEVSINRKVDNTAYSGMCDDIRFGVSLIFYLQNSIDFISIYEKIKETNHMYNVLMAGLSNDGKIILPVDKSTKTQERRNSEKNHHNKLISEAKQGNQEAIDNLTIEDIDTYAMITRRAKYEDLYSIVDTSFYPYGAESDNYSIIGTIMEYKEVCNDVTGEQIYEMVIECNELIISLCINKKDLFGTPLVGARFKGTIWLQGYVDFKEYFWSN